MASPPSIRRSATAPQAGVGRRELLAGLAAGLVCLLRPRGHQSHARADVHAATPPRYWINIVPTGGIDAVFTTDPRTSREVAPGIDVPYPARDIVEVGAMRLGPHLAPLASLAPRIGIVNGILVRTANHFTGIEQAARLRTHTTTRTPAVFDIIGSRRDSQALAHATLNATFRQARTGSFFGSSAAGDFGGGDDVFAMIDQLSPDERRDLARILRAKATVQGRGAADDRREAADAVKQVSRLLERAADLPPFVARPWLTASGGGEDEVAAIVPSLQRALWLLEHDLAATVTVFLGNGSWDSHTINTRVQSLLTPVFARALARFIAELDVASNRHGKLADLTAICVGSEIGRFPSLNTRGGKDHFPQISMLVAGRPFGLGRQRGATGKRLEALPVSTARGAADAAGDRLILDDVGHTLLRIAGCDPVAYAVPGRMLQFLLAEAS